LNRQRDAPSNPTNKGNVRPFDELQGAIISAGRRSPADGERPTTGSDEGNSFKDIPMTNRKFTCPN